MTKTEAAKHLGISERTLERYVKDRRISVRLEPGKTKPVPIFERDDLDQFKASEERPDYYPAVQKMATQNDRENDRGAGVSLSTDGALARPEVFMQIVEAVAKATAREVTSALAQIPTLATQNDTGDKPHVPTSEKLLLSLEEAAALSNLSTARLRAAIRDGALDARQIGRGFKVMRGELERFVASLFEVNR